MTSAVFFADARRRCHAMLRASVLRSEGGIPSNADRHSRASTTIATGILERLGSDDGGERLAGQKAGSRFEEICKGYLEEVFPRLSHLRPGQWRVSKCEGGEAAIAQFDQYEHLAALAEASKASPELAAALGSDYLIKPDVVIFRSPEADESINSAGALVDESQAYLTPLRFQNSEKPILHASVSCKWTLRSVRAQNARSEALNLVRNRKGRLPHVVVVTGEPMPSRIASIALGTGDIDCVYHFAMSELVESVEALVSAIDNEKDKRWLRTMTKEQRLLDTMIEGKRLRDIADLPLDLAI